jgi:hypothetical protein
MGEHPVSIEELRRGDYVEVRRPTEILATLDERGTLAGLPFMPEMADYCGRRFVVDRRADKICDTIKYTGSRRLPDTVLLDDMRCTGFSHGGCQAACRLFWKQDWLQKTAPDAPATRAFDPSELRPLLARISPNVKRNVDIDGHLQERWACQNTDLFIASDPLKFWDPRPYIGQYANGNVRLSHCLRITARAAVEETMDKLRLAPDVTVRGTAETPPYFEPLNLQPGECVEVRSKQEIMATLTSKGYNRGLWFDREMAALCGGKYRVRERVVHFIDECQDNGRMIKMRSDAVTLEGAFCSGELSRQRWFCPRQIYPYWRECWLRRVPG